MNGNEIKVRYDGQDREAICSYCHQKGHYKTKKTKKHGGKKNIIVTGINLDLLKKFGFGTFNLVATFKERAAN